MAIYLVEVHEDDWGLLDEVVDTYFNRINVVPVEPAEFKWIYPVKGGKFKFDVTRKGVRKQSIAYSSVTDAIAELIDYRVTKGF